MAFHWKVMSVVQPFFFFQRRTIMRKLVTPNNLCSLAIVLVMLVAIGIAWRVIKESEAKFEVNKDILAYLKDKEVVVAREIYFAMRPYVHDFEKGRYAGRLERLKETREPLGSFIHDCQRVLVHELREAAQRDVDEKDVEKELAKRLMKYKLLFDAAQSVSQIRDLLTSKELSAEERRSSFVGLQRTLDDQLAILEKKG